MRARVITVRNRASSKNNAACTSTDDLIVKNLVDACTSTDDLIVKNHVDACTSTDDICTNENKPSTNKPSTNENEPCTNENEPCSNENELCTNENEPCANENEPCTNKNEASINENDNDSEADDDDDDDSVADDSVNNDFPNLSDKTIYNLIIVAKIGKEILNNNTEIKALISEAENTPRDDFLLKLDKYKKLNKLLDNLLNYIWKIIYGENKINNEINSVDIDKKRC